MATPNDDTAAALARLAADGSDLTRPLSMDFFLAAPNNAAAQAISTRARALGFETSVEQDAESQEWTCYCTRVIVPTYATVVSIERQLDALAKEFGGFIDGFGSYGNADEAR